MRSPAVRARLAGFAGPHNGVFQFVAFSMPQRARCAASLHRGVWRLSEAIAVELANANRDLSTANEKLQELDRLRRQFLAQAAANIGNWEWDIVSGRVQWSPEVEDMLPPRHIEEQNSLSQPLWTGRGGTVFLIRLARDASARSTAA